MRSLLHQYLLVPLRTAIALVRGSVRTEPRVTGGRRVLFLSSINSVEFVTQDLHLARWLRARGHTPTVVYFPGIYATADIKNVTNGAWRYERERGLRGVAEIVVRTVAAATVMMAFRLAAWTYCRRHGIRLRRVSWFSLRASARNEALASISVQRYLESESFVAQVDASFIRRFRGAPFDPSRSEHVSTRRLLIEDYRKMVVMTHLVASAADYDVALFPMPYYIQWGTFDYLATHTSITPRVIGRRPGFRVAITDGSIFIDQMPWLWTRYLDEVDVEAYRRDVLEELHTHLERAEPLPDLPDGAIALYPNVAWDGLTGHEEALFRDLLDWLEQSIRFCRELGIPVILKLHPVSPEPQLADFLSAESRSWCIVLKNESSYALASRVALNVVFNGTLAFELPILGLPVISLATTHYSDKGVCHTPASREEYWSLLRGARSDEVTSKLVTRDFAEASLRYYWFNRTYRWRELRAYDAAPMPDSVFASTAPHVVEEWLVRPPS